MSSVSVVVPHYYKERLPNLSLLVSALRHGTVVPDEILVWNNDAPFDAPEGALVFQSPFNVGCQARFLAAMAARSDYVLFQDNDCRVGPRTVERMLEWAGQLPGIVSLDGYDIKRGAAYFSRRIVNCANTAVPTRVNVTLGRMELVSRRTLRELLAGFPFDPETRMDDLELSARAGRWGVSCWVVPMSQDAALVNLPTHGVGSCVSTAGWHYAERERVYARLFPAKEEVFA